MTELEVAHTVKQASSFDDEKFKNFIEIIGKLTIGFVAICYVIGLFVVNIYLSKYGAYPLSLLRLNYITAGLWSMMPILFPSFAIIVVYFLIKANIETWNGLVWERGFGIGVSLLSFTVFIYFPIYILLRYKFIDWNWLVTLITGLIVCGYLFLFINSFEIRYIKADIPPRTKNLLKTIPRTAFGTIALAVTIVHLAIFAYSFYGVIPSHLGGGKPQLVNLIVEAEPSFEEILKENGIDFVNSITTQEKVLNLNQENEKKEEKVLRKTVDVGLLLITEDSFIIIGKEGAISLPKDIVKAILYKQPIDMEFLPLPNNSFNLSNQ